VFCPVKSPFHKSGINFNLQEYGSKTSTYSEAHFPAEAVPAEAVGVQVIANPEVLLMTVALRGLKVARPSSVKPISRSICPENPA
jgi:hypothetical protein